MVMVIHTHTYIHLAETMHDITLRTYIYQHLYPYIYIDERVCTNTLTDLHCIQTLQKVMPALSHVL